MTKRKLEISISYITVLLFFELPIIAHYNKLDIVAKLLAFGRYAMSAVFLVWLLLIAVTKKYRGKSIRLRESKTKGENVSIILESNNVAGNGYRVIGLAILLNFSLIIAATMNDTIYATFVLSCVTRFGFIAFNFIMYQKYHEELLDIYAVVLTAFIVLNSLTQIFVPEGFKGYGDGRVWLLGLKNTTTPFLLLDITIISILLFLKYYEKKYWALFSVTMLSTFINRSSTGIIVIFLIFCTVISLLLKPARNIVNRKLLFFGYIAIWLFFFFVIYYSQELRISDIIGGVFGKNGSFSGRTNVWKQAISYFNKNYLWGAGIGTEFHPWGDPSIVVYSAHNSMLEFLCKFGIFAGIAFAVVVTLTFLKSLRIKNKEIRTITATSFLLVFLSMQFEAEGNNYLFWMQALLPYLLFDKENLKLDIRRML